MTMNPLWARYMQQHQQQALVGAGGGAGSQFGPVLPCRPQMAASNPASGIVSAPASSLSSAIDRAKLGGQF